MKLQGKGARICPSGRTHACVMSCCHKDGNINKTPPQKSHNFISLNINIHGVARWWIIHSRLLVMSSNVTANVSTEETMHARNNWGHRDDRGTQHKWRQRGGEVYYYLQDAGAHIFRLINGVGQLKRLIAVSGLKGNLRLHQVVQRAAAFPSVWQGDVFKMRILNLFVYFPE